MLPGGGRFDAGMVCYMRTSDDTDAVERLYIQEDTGMVYPISTMGAHISSAPNHQIDRTLMGAGIPLDTRKDHQGTLTVFEICS